MNQQQQQQQTGTGTTDALILRQERTPPPFDSEDWCERCYQDMTPPELVFFEYSTGNAARALAVSLCFPCLKRTVEEMMQVPVGERMALLRTLYDAWWKAYEEREGQEDGV